MPRGVYPRRDYCKNHPDREIVKRGLCAECYKEQTKRYSLKKLYSMGLLEYQRLYDNQLGVCAICEQPETAIGVHGEIRLLNVDHDHVTGKVRGLLCSNCNTALGLFRDEVRNLVSAIKYLLDHNKRG